MKAQREDYLTSIYKLITRENFATNKSISSYLKVSPAAVSEMIRKLNLEGLLLLDKNRILLSRDGVLHAEKILSKHRLWELYLNKFLNYDWQDVHERARLLQYATDDRLMQALNEKLEYPVSCPHGGLIYINQKGETKKIIVLSKANKKIPLFIRRINDNKELLQYVERKGLKLNMEIEFLEEDNFDSSLVIFANNTKISLSKKAAEQIFVSEF